MFKRFVLPLLPFVGMGILIGAVAAPFTIVVARLDWIERNGLGMWIAALLPALVWVPILPFILRANLLKSLASALAPVENDLRWPDPTQLEELTQKWRDLSFEVRDEWVANRQHPELGLSFSRLLENEELAVVAWIYQIRMPAKALPMEQSVVSLWGNEAALEQAITPTLTAPIAAPMGEPSPVAPMSEELPIWSLTLHTQKLPWFSNVLLHPRHFNVRADTSEPSALLERHRELQAQVSHALGREPLRHALARVVRRDVEWLRRMWRSRLQNTAALPMFWRALRRGSRHKEYWGEFEGRI